MQHNFGLLAQKIKGKKSINKNEHASTCSLYPYNPRHQYFSLSQVQYHSPGSWTQKLTPAMVAAYLFNANVKPMVRIDSLTKL